MPWAIAMFDISDTPKNDAEALLDVLIPFAEKMLRAHREFFPFGAEMSTSGKIALSSATDGSKHPESQNIIDMLRMQYIRLAAAGEIKACATIYDSRVTPPNSSVKQDAISALIDHRDGYSVTVFFPYTITDGATLVVGRPFAVNRKTDVFTSSSDN
ncbi:MAG TPA: hypothetical protein VFN13_02925 [Rudaea sp.]|nr:hypothetical protein [Rudaea sp.]